MAYVDESPISEPCERCGTLNSVFAFECGEDIPLDATSDAKEPCGPLIQIGFASSLALLLACMVAVVLVRTSPAVLPVYALVAAGILHLYAVTYSRGGAFRSAALWFSVIVSVWGAWELAGWLDTTDATRSWAVTDLLRSFRNALEPRLGAVSVIAWMVGTLWAVWLGKRTMLPGIRLPSGFFLATGAFVFGFWGCWITLLRLGSVTERILEVAVAAGLVVPFVALLFVARSQSGGDGGSARWSQIPILVLSVFAVYSGLSIRILEIVEFLLGGFAPALVGVTTLPDVDHGWVETVLDWRATVGELSLALGLVVVTAASVVRTVREVKLSRPEWHRRAKVGLQRRTAGARGMASVAIHFSARLAGLAFDLSLVGYRLAMFLVGFFSNLGRELRSLFGGYVRYVIRAGRFVALPFASFTILAFVATVVIQNLRSYLLDGSSVSAREVWGEVATLLFLVIVLCGASFGLAPAAPRHSLSSGTMAAIVVGVYGFAILTVASFSLPLVAFALRTRGVSFEAGEAGPLFWLNVLVSGAFVAVLLAFYYLTAKRTETRSANSLLVPVVVVALLSFWWGFGGIEGGLARSRDTSRTRPAEEVVPPVLNDEATQLRLSRGTVRAGSTVTIRGVLPADARYTAALDDERVVLGEVASGDDGQVRVVLKIPASATTGEHMVVILDRGERLQEIPIDIVA